MVLANSHRISRVPQYLGVQQARSIIFAYRTVTFFGEAFQLLRLIIDFLTRRLIQNSDKLYPSTPITQRFWAWHVIGLGSFPFARRYLENRCYFLFLGVLRCFSSPRYPSWPMYSDKNDTVLTVPGCPIQKSPDQRLFSSSPKLIAAFRVFLLHLTPRHPPFALSSLATILLTQISLNALLKNILIKEICISLPITQP